ncbi:flagellar basal body P-ring formation chaperone FlgA [Chachezhania antarctica]|uniref:flagellar basal body P-ring formation chaperone FlgA n=1 Tax=Chachezhania antarctica TaxID=2340860 RepID=UPI000EAD5921|nr:flagellar basal body P-ring formation chaperone FlgA [Chachezhania antarctica]|tara:strand:- start:10553 stop:10969 length:417 start_codon:yes stop_codon:yes gene_type:complete
MRLTLPLILALLAQTAAADILVPARLIRAKEIVRAEDLVTNPADVPGALSQVDEIVGLEARVALYPGRPVRPGDVGPPALVGRNDVVTLIFNSGGLTITTEGRALGRGAHGEHVRVMNLNSRNTVTGKIRSDGAVVVQ